MTNLIKLQSLLEIQGGTIHQMSEVIGLSVSDILNLHNVPYSYDKLSVLGKSVGLVAATCPGDYLKTRLMPEYRGNVSFWKAALRSYDLRCENLI